MYAGLFQSWLGNTQVDDRELSSHAEVQPTRLPGTITGQDAEIQRSQEEEDRRYRARPAAKAKHKSSPRWYGPLIIVLMAVGVLIIVLNYVGLIPGTDGTASPVWLWVGLGLIGVGFVGTTFWC